MENNEDTGSPGWSSLFFMQTTEDVAKAVAAVSAAHYPSLNPKPSVVFSSKDESGGQLQKFRRRLSTVIKGLSQPPETKSSTYNPEVLTSQKHQWGSFQMQYLDHRPLKEPSRLFQCVVVVGLHPNCDIQTLQRQYIDRKSEGSGRLRRTLSSQNHSRVEPNLVPQVMSSRYWNSPFAKIAKGRLYICIRQTPPTPVGAICALGSVFFIDKQLPLKHKDLLSFCFPEGVEVRAVEKTPSMSKLNVILLGQEHFKQSDLSFVFRLQVADDSTLYGCCVLVDEIVQKPSGLLSMIAEKQQPTLSHHILTTQRCYCILSRLPFFELHFGV